MIKGQVVYKNGDQYHGQLSKNNNTLLGIGTYKFKDGSLYVGQFKDSLFNGHGKLIDKFNDIVIIGQFINGKAQGIGRILYGAAENYQSSSVISSSVISSSVISSSVISSSVISSSNTNDSNNSNHPKGQYQGQIHNGYRSGKGKFQFIYPPQQLHNNQLPLLYQGQFQDDAFNGHGKLTFTMNSNHYYIGHFADNLYHGDGQYHTKQFIYIGQFNRGILQGKGMMRYIQTGQYYEGEYMNNAKNGYGKYYYVNTINNQNKANKNNTKNNHSMFYLGQWKNDQKHGKGKLAFLTNNNSNNNYYQGQFVDDKPYGQFKCSVDNIQFIAQIQGDILNGPIKIISNGNQSDNILISGNYKKNEKDGIFVMQKYNKYQQKCTYHGQFREGKQLPYTVSYSHRF